MQYIGYTFALVVVLGYSCLIGVTLAYHRELTHKAIRLWPPLRLVLCTHVWLVTGMKPREWVAVHRKHHAHVDVPGDPHSPWLNGGGFSGMLKVLLKNVVMYHHVAVDTVTVERYAHDVPEGWLDRHLYKYGWLGPTLLGPVIALLLLARFGLNPWIIPCLAVAWIFCPVFFMYTGGFINAVGHMTKNYASPTVGHAMNIGRNWLLRVVFSILTCGENMHNNHHTAQRSARFSGYDVGWWIIQILRPIHLVKLTGPVARP